MKKLHNGKPVPRITGTQNIMLDGMRSLMLPSGQRSFWGEKSAKSWINDKGMRVWNFDAEGDWRGKGDPWHTLSGEALVRKGLIEPSFTLVHDGGYPYPVGCEIQFWRLTPLGMATIW